MWQTGEERRIWGLRALEMLFVGTKSAKREQPSPRMEREKKPSRVQLFCGAFVWF